MHTQPDIEQLFCALMFLLSRQARFPESPLARDICQHLAWLVEHPDTDHLPVLRKTCRGLLLHWQAVGAELKTHNRKKSGSRNPSLHKFGQRTERTCSLENADTRGVEVVQFPTAPRYRGLSMIRLHTSTTPDTFDLQPTRGRQPDRRERKAGCRCHTRAAIAM